MHKTHLWNAWLEDTKLAYADLTEADLGDANLSKTDLWWARLDEANLRGADLTNANLCWARMPMADLWGANLEGASFEGTNLQAIKVNDDTNWGLYEPDQGNPLMVSLSELGRSFRTFNITRIYSAFYELFRSLVRIASRIYWGKPAPIMYLDKNASTDEEFKIARFVYSQAYEACKAAGLSDKAGWFFYRAQICRRKSQHKKWSPGWLLEYFVFDCISGYGERPRWVIASMLVVMTFFGMVNWIGGMYGGFMYNGEEYWDIGFFGGLYFSIVSFTTVGYGDITPNHYATIGKILRFINVFESLLGALLISLALVTYTRIAIRD